MAETQAQTNRDLLFASGCGLVLAGLFPYPHARYLLWEAAASSSSYTSTATFETDLLLHPATNTVFDPATCFIGAAFALLGVGVLLLSSSALPRHLIRVSVKAIGIPLFVVAMGAATLVQSFYTGTDVAAAWQASALRSFDREGDTSLEIKFNHQFCGALGDRVCRDGSLEDAKALFARLHDWPSEAADSQASVSEYCDRSAAGTRKQVCQLCRIITHSPLNERPSALLSVIQSPSPDAIHWCGEYLMSQPPSTNPQDSPFQSHREEILRNWDESPASLTFSVRLLVVLIWFSLTSMAGMVQLYSWPKRTGCQCDVPKQTTQVAPEMDDSEWDLVGSV